MNRTCLCLAALLTLAMSPAFAQISSVPNGINFQGRIATPSGNPVPDGTYFVRFSLWDALTAGTEKYNKTVANVQVKNGTFAVTLDVFPVGTFNGNLWLEIKIGTDAPLTPRTPLVTVPYAFKSDLALTVPDGSITNAKLALGTLTADKFAANILNPLAWLLGGNSATNPATHFLGTTDNNPLELRANNRRAMRFSYAENTASSYRSINVLGGSEINSIGASVVGATIAGGGYDAFTGTDFPNRVTADFGTVTGGYGNTASGQYATITGGNQNTASGSFSATVAGGALNTASSIYATVAGGTGNTASGNSATVGGGYQNFSRNDYATVAGGALNVATANYATVAGGTGNAASGNSATVGGGFRNASGVDNATVAGGGFNIASGDVSFAAGNHANANHSGAFVWADNSSNTNFASTTINQFNVRASGGVRIFKSDLTIGVTLLANDSSWNSVSDRNKKTDFGRVDTLDILERLVAIPISTWNYKGVENPVRHIGPMAQDFFAAFKVGMDDKHIGTIDADGVALAAVQGLNRKLELSNAAMKKENAALKAKNAEMEARLDALTGAVAKLQANQK